MRGCVSLNFIYIQVHFVKTYGIEYFVLYSRNKPIENLFDLTELGYTVVETYGF